MSQTVSERKILFLPKRLCGSGIFTPYMSRDVISTTDNIHAKKKQQINYNGTLSLSKYEFHITINSIYLSDSLLQFFCRGWNLSKDQIKVLDLLKKQ